MLLLFLMGFHIWNDFLGVTSIFGMTSARVCSCIPLRVPASLIGH
jgi:hypothetical protein